MSFIFIQARASHGQTAGIFTVTIPEYEMIDAAEDTTTATGQGMVDGDTIMTEAPVANGKKRGLEEFSEDQWSTSTSPAKRHKVRTPPAYNWFTTIVEEFSGLNLNDEPDVPCPHTAVPPYAAETPLTQAEPLVDAAVTPDLLSPTADLAVVETAQSPQPVAQSPPVPPVTILPDPTQSPPTPPVQSDNTPPQPPPAAQPAEDRTMFLNFYNRLVKTHNTNAFNKEANALAASFGKATIV